MLPLSPCRAPRSLNQSRRWLSSAVVDDASKPVSLLSRRSQRLQPIGQNSPSTPLRATSFVSARSAHKRDQATEKWFTDIRKIDIGDANPVPEPLPRKKRIRPDTPKQHEMRPRTDLNALFASSTLRSAASLRLQNKKELGGDYTSYLPDGHVNPLQLPVDYARLVLGRNKHIPLNVQTGALSIIENTIQGRTLRKGRTA